MSGRSIKKTFLIVLLPVMATIAAKAQGNLPYADDKPFHFGFSLGFNSMDFGITQSNENVGGKMDTARVSELQPGFSVGIIGNMRLTRYLNLRFTPTLHLGSRVLQYNKDSQLPPISISSIPIAFPLYLKYSAERKNNYRPYLLFGGGASIDLATDPTKPVLLKPMNFYTEFGVGCDIYFSFFKMAPEIKFALGFNDMLAPLSERGNDDIKENDQRYTSALSKLTSKMITLSFNFE